MFSSDLHFSRKKSLVEMNKELAGKITNFFQGKLSIKSLIPSLVSRTTITLPESVVQLKSLENRLVLPETIQFSVDKFPVPYDGNRTIDRFTPDF